MGTSEAQYRAVAIAAADIRTALETLGRWQSESLPEEKFENMGAFGSETMTYEQWIQFVLLPAIEGIISEQGDFPDESNVAAYGVRYFDGDPNAGPLLEALQELDDLINGPTLDEEQSLSQFSPAPNVVDRLPDVGHTILDNLHLFEGEGLEDQLRSLEAVFSVCSDTVRPELSELLERIAAGLQVSASADRVRKAAEALRSGQPMTVPYDHEAAMRKYKEEFRKGYQ